jgi:hypothetical protein
MFLVIFSSSSFYFIFFPCVSTWVFIVSSNYWLINQIQLDIIIAFLIKESSAFDSRSFIFIRATLSFFSVFSRRPRSYYLSHTYEMRENNQLHWLNTILSCEAADTVRFVLWIAVVISETMTSRQEEEKIWRLSPFLLPPRTNCGCVLR